MKRNPTPENRGRRTKGGRKRCAGRFAISSANCSKVGQIGPTTFSHMNEISITKAEMWRTAEAIKQAGCRDVLIISTPEYVRFVALLRLSERKFTFCEMSSLKPLKKFE